MADLLPIPPRIKVWVKRRKNNTRKGRSSRRNNPGGSNPTTVSLTLEWVEYGRHRFLSLGPHATAGYARHMGAESGKQLNFDRPSEVLDPSHLGRLPHKYLDTYFPGHDLTIDGVF